MWPKGHCLEPDVRNWVPLVIIPALKLAGIEIKLTDEQINAIAEVIYCRYDQQA